MKFADHPFSGTFFHAFYLVVGSLHYLPFLIGVTFVVDIMSEMLALRDETARTV